MCQLNWTAHTLVRRLASTGIDGALLNWPLYEEGMLTFQRETLPLLKQTGLG